jgi:hypothetical protein
MADIKISELPILSTADATDILPVVDVSGNVTKRVTVSGTAAAVAANLPADSITSTMLNPSKTVDANGWTVYDYGTWKEYAKIVTGLAVSSLGSLANASGGSVNAPSGVTPDSLYFAITPYTGYDLSRYWATAIATSTTAGGSITINFRNVTGSTLSDSGMQVKLRAISS